MRTLFIVAEECANSEKADEIFRRRGWSPVDDQSVPLKGRKQVRKTEHNTPLISLEIEELEYGVAEE